MASNDNLEKKTSGFYSTAKRTLTGLVAGTALTAAGCTAPNYYDADWNSTRQDAHRAYMKWEYGNEENAVTKFATEALAKDATPVKFEMTNTFEDFADGKLDGLNGAAERKQRETYSAIIKQNEAIQKIFDGAGIQRYALARIKDNADIEVLQSTGQVDRAKVQEALTELYNKCKETSYSQRQELKTLLAGNDEATKFFDFNEKSLSRLNKYLVALSDALALEGCMEEMTGVYQYSAEIQKNLDGTDQLSDDGLGKKTLENLLLQKLGGANGICSAKSKVATAYQGFSKEGRSGKDLLLSDIYTDIMGKIWEESKDWSDTTRHTIFNEHLSNALSMATEALVNEKITRPEYQALVRYMTKQAVTQIGDGQNNASGPDALDYFLTIGGAILPITDLIMIGLNAQWALAADKYAATNTSELEAVVDSLTRGNEIKGGWRNSDHVLGDASYKRFQFWTGVAGFGIKVALTATGAIFWDDIFGGGGSTSGGAQGTPPVGGGGGIGGGIK